jgi:hypothetical protein
VLMALVLAVVYVFLRRGPSALPEEV